MGRPEGKRRRTGIDWETCQIPTQTVFHDVENRSTVQCMKLQLKKRLIFEFVGRKFLNL